MAAVGEAMMLTSTQMTEAEFDAKRQELGHRKHTGARWDQELARLYARSGWTQERLAKKEKVTHQRISQWQLFGRFLEFATTVAKSEIPLLGLTEGRFRSCWAMAFGASNERERFREVSRLLIEDSKRGGASHKGMAKKFFAEFANGQYRSEEDMFQMFGEALTKQCLRYAGNKANAATYGVTKPETKQVGKVRHHRIFRTVKSVSATELKEKLSPIIKDMHKEGNKTEVTAMSAQCVKRLATMLDKLLKDWTREE